MVARTLKSEHHCDALIQWFHFESTLVAGVLIEYPAKIV